MGCDGGTIPRRNELVKVKQKPESRDQTSHLIFQWRYCNITQQLLQNRIVTCGLGRLYSKSAIIEALITKESLPSHVKNLKDVKDLRLTPNPEFSESTTDQRDVPPYVCPITGVEMSGKYNFVTLWSCGCVFAERGLIEIGGEFCPRCQTRFDETDIVILNPGGEKDVETVTKRMEIRKKRKKSFGKEISGVKKIKTGLVRQKSFGCDRQKICRL